MTDLRDRGSAFESKHAHDEETEFKIMARRNKLLGLWAAGLLGKSDDAESYAKEVVLSDFEEPGDDDVLRKVLGDLEKAGKAVSAKEVREKMDMLYCEAQEQIMNETP